MECGCRCRISNDGVCACVTDVCYDGADVAVVYYVIIICVMNRVYDAFMLLVWVCW